MNYMFLTAVYLQIKKFNCNFLVSLGKAGETCGLCTRRLDTHCFILVTYCSTTNSG